MHSGVFFELGKKQEELQQLIVQSQSPTLWTEPQKAQTVTRQITSLKRLIENWQRLNRELADLKEMVELFGGDDKSRTELEEHFSQLEHDLKEMELESIFQDEADAKDALLTIHPGAGGTESCDWAQMLLRMYLHYIERKGWEHSILDLQPGEEAGVKSATVEVRGEHAYGLLKSETGVHRLVRVSPFDANKRRHTSFVAVFVYPEVEEIEVKINPDDLKLDTFRASGHGGQNVNKISSAVRITHIPTGIVVSCQQERSQFYNRQNALKVLRAKLYNYYKDEQSKELEKLEEKKTDIAWGHQIRSYVLFPYQMVKDHRTSFETSQVNKVLDGDLEDFIFAYLTSTK